jgi:hypothetical protein
MQTMSLSVIGMEMIQPKYPQPAPDVIPAQDIVTCSVQTEVKLAR